MAMVGGQVGGGPTVIRPILASRSHGPGRLFLEIELHYKTT